MHRHFLVIESLMALAVSAARAFCDSARLIQDDCVVALDIQHAEVEIQEVVAVQLFQSLENAYKVSNIRSAAIMAADVRHNVTSRLRRFF